MNKLLSVIVPIYNVEKVLRRGVNSILAQDYNPMEVILVDDGSPDNCPEICDEYATKDERIKVIHKPNGGLSSARNAGLDKAKGEYISFIDSDDSILSNMYSEMIGKLEENNLDMIGCKAQRVKKGKIKGSPDSGKLKILDARYELIDCLKNDGGSVWSKIYKKEVVGTVRFPEGRNFEDTAVMFKFIANAKRIGFLNKTFYNYFYNDNSITQTSFKAKARWDYVLARKDALDYTIEHNLPCVKECESMYAKALLSCLTAVYANGSKEEKESYVPKIKTILLELRKKEGINCKLNSKYRLWLLFCGRIDAIHIISAKISFISKKLKKYLNKN